MTVRKVGRNQAQVETYDRGDRLVSGVNFCFAAPSPMTTGAFGELVRGVADALLLSA